MSASRYAFTHASWVPAAPDRVHAVLVDLERYPAWWRQVRAVASLGPDRALVVCRSVLPYDLELVLDAVSRDPRHLEVTISGPIDGFARWTLAGQRGGTRLDYEQVVTARGALAWASYVLKPVLRANHAAMMRGFDRGLAGWLSAGRGNRTSGPSS
jgi:hypothetical protein